MMASPASTAAFVPLSDVDPWDWSTEDVVTALCSPEGELRTLEPDVYPEPSALAQAIRENYMRGKNLIRHDVDRVYIRDYLGIKATGWQDAVLDTIMQLRSRSVKFHDSVQMKASFFTLHSQRLDEHSGLPQTPRIPAQPATNQLPKYPFPGNDCDALETENMIGSTLRAGEEHVVDVIGRKRRRLNLSGVPADADSGMKDVPQVALPGTDSADFNVQLRLEDVPTYIEVNSLSEDNSQTLIIGPSSPMQPSHLTGNPASESLPEPGTVVVDIKGRKRMRPFLVQESSGDVAQSPSPISPQLIYPNEDPSSINVRTLDIVDHKEMNAPSLDSFRRRGPGKHRPYLGSKALPVDEIFYGNTRIGEEVRYPDQHETLVPVNSMAVDTENWAYLSDDVYGAGLSISVNSRIKYRLLNNQLLELQHGNVRLYGLVPYPSRISKRRLSPSMNLISSSVSGVSIRRVRRSAWLKVDPISGTKQQASYKQPHATESFDISEDESLLAQLGENETQDWDFLEKWRFVEGEQDVLPLYGESGSEGELDYDTWREIEKEQMVELDRPLGPSRHRHLTTDVVSDTIEASIAQIVEDWRSQKLPTMELKAWWLWTKSRRDKSKRDQIIFLSAHIERLKTRLEKLVKELQSEIWSSTQQLKKQCRCLEETIYDREASTWRIGILELRSPPCKPIKADKTLPVKKANSKPEPLQSGEEDLVSNDSSVESFEDELDGFIVDDDVGTDDKLSASDSLSSVRAFGVDTSNALGSDTELSGGDLGEVAPIDVSGNESGDQVVDSPVSDVDQLAQKSMAGRGQIELQTSGRSALSPDSSEMQVHEYLAVDHDDEPEYEPEEPVVDDYEPEYEPAVADVDKHELEHEPGLSTSDDYEDQYKESKEANELVIGVDHEYEPPLPDNTKWLGGNVIHISDKRAPTPSNFIDLTLLSDSVEPSPAPSPPSPQLKLEDHLVRTPEKKERSPFERARRAKPAFKPPPFPSHIVDLGSDELKSQGEDLLTSTKPTMPELWEVDKIRGLSSRYLEERQDRKRLLTYIIMRTTSERRQAIATATHNVTSALMQLHVWTGLGLLERNITKMQPTDTIKNPDAVMRMATWYVNWHMCKIYPKKGGIPLEFIQSARSTEGEQGFEEYYNFLVEQLNLIGLHDESSSNLFLLSTSNNQLQSKKRQQTLDGDMDSDDPEGLTQRKKRKRVLVESQEAFELRQSARVRASERDQRKEQLQKQFTRMGTTSGDPSTMIVNGKSGDDMIVVNADLGQRLQPHQLEGIQFMWGEIVTGGAAAQGCLLAHTMGLGKTMQVITLLVTIAEASNNPNPKIRNQIPESLQSSRTLVLCPPSLINNWFDEFLLWTPKTASDQIGQIRRVTSSLKAQDRIYEIEQWAETGGVLLLGYTTFKDLVLNKPKRKSGEQARDLAEQQHEELCKILLEYPNIVVADEAHAMKNKANDVAKAIKQIKTESRIALTGSPLANNLDEYYSIVDWVAPNYLGGSKEFRQKYADPINKGLYADASRSDQRTGLKKLQVLKAELAPKVLRADISVLQGLLKGKTEFVIRVPLTEVQFGAYSLYADYMLNASKSKEPGSAKLWAWLAILGLLCNHPQCFLNKLTQKGAGTAKKPKKPKALSPRATNNVEDAASIEADAEALLEESAVTLGIPQSMVDEEVALFKSLTVPIESETHAYKMQVLFQILKFSTAVGDKTLVFSHSLKTLDYVQDQLKRKRMAFARLDGVTKMVSRQQLTKDFNAGNVNVCLISTRAGGQGLNMFGANRVVILDEHFNPMHEEQAIGRAYRIGQLKHVYVYRLTVGGTFEQALQDQSLFKLQLANRVVDKKNPQRHALKGARQYLFPPQVLDQKDLTAFEGKDTAVLDKILTSRESPMVIRSIDLSETFHQEVEEPLTAEERQETEQMVKEEQLRRTDPKAYDRFLEQRLAGQIKAQMLSLTQRPPQSVPGPPSTAHATTGLPNSMPEPDAMTGLEVTRNYMPSPIVQQTRRIGEPKSTAVGTGPGQTRIEKQGLSTAHTLSPAQNMDTNVPGLEPILGGNTRVAEHVASQSPERRNFLIEPQHSLPQIQIAPAEFGNSLDISNSNTAAENFTKSPVTTSLRSRTRPETLTDDIHKRILYSVEDLCTLLAPVIAEHIEKGNCDRSVANTICRTLASSILRHSERTTTTQDEYLNSVHEAVRSVQSGEESVPLVQKASRKILKRSQQQGTVVSSTSPSERSNSLAPDQTRSMATGSGVDHGQSPTSVTVRERSPKKTNPDECVVM